MYILSKDLSFVTYIILKVCEFFFHGYHKNILVKLDHKEVKVYEFIRISQIVQIVVTNVMTSNTKERVHWIVIWISVYLYC